jgi:hypothetical protein
MTILINNKRKSFNFLAADAKLLKIERKAKEILDFVGISSY